MPPSTLKHAKGRKPAVIRLGAGIPGGDAFELARTLAKPLPATKFVTETDNPTYMARARAVGAANCLLKNFSVDGCRERRRHRQGARPEPNQEAGCK